jgi:transcriptional regulator with XRE-family HTH domain
MARSRRLRPTYIRQWRESRGLTLEQLAEAIGVTHPTLSRIENGKVAYTEERLERIADELQAQAVIPLDYAIFSISSIWAPSGASMKATWRPLLTCSSMTCAPLLRSLAISLA